MSMSFAQHSINIKSLPPWDYEKWTYTEPQQTNYLKKKLLMDSLDLIKEETDNEIVCYEILKQALDARLFDIVFQAVYSFSPSSKRCFLASITDIVKEMRYWKHFSEEFVDYCEKRALQSSECQSNWGYDGYRPDLRSRTLGYLGRYHFFNRRPEYAIKLWDEADDPIAIDEVISDMCETIAKQSPQDLEAFLTLVNMIKTKTIKAKTIGILSKYA